MAVPIPSSLVATADILGRVFVKYSMDLCIMNALNGYRDNNIASLKECGLVQDGLSRCLNVLYLHEFSKMKRSAALQLMKGSKIALNTGQHVFSLKSEGIM